MTGEYGSLGSSPPLCQRGGRGEFNGEAESSPGGDNGNVLPPQNPS